MKLCHQARWFVKTELGGYHALELKSGGFRSRRRVSSQAKTAWHGESNSNRQATSNMPLRDSLSHRSAEPALENTYAIPIFICREKARAGAAAATRSTHTASN